METQSGVITVPASTGTQEIAHTLENPKVFFFFGGLGDAEGDNADAWSCFGVDDGTVHYCQAIWFDDAFSLGSWEGTTTPRSDYSILYRDNADLIEGKITALDNDSFTITWDTVSSGKKIYWVGIGGEEISCYLGDLAMNTSTGDQAETGVGFQGEAALFFPFLSTAFNNYRSALDFSLGAALSSSQRFCCVAQAVSTYNPSRAESRRYGNACVALGTATVSGSLDYLADFVSWGGDGFTINFSDAPTSASVMFYVILAGLECGLGSFAQPTETGEQTIEGSLGLTALLTMFLSRGEIAAASNPTDHASCSMGFGLTAAMENALWLGALKGETSVTVADHYFASTRCISIKEAGTPTLKADAQYLDQAAGSLKVDWLTVDATQRQLDYLALGTPYSPPAIVPFRRRIEGY